MVGAKNLSLKKSKKSKYVFEDIILQIDSPEALCRLKELNVRSKVLGGLILRPTKIALRLAKSNPQVGDTIILMGISKEIVEDLETFQSK